MQGHVIYSSKYGATAEYAQALGTQLGFPVTPLNRARGWESAEVLVLGGWIFAGKVSCGDWLVKNWPRIQGKRVFLFTTSGADRKDPVHLKNFRANYPEAITQAVELYPLNGRMILSKLNFFDRFIMKLGAKMAAKKDPETAAKMLQDADKVNLADLGPLVERIKGLK